MSLDLSIIRDLWQSGRPYTGLYAFILSGYGFLLHDLDWNVAILAMIVFALVTMSIMRYNDLIDADHDRRKGKSFAVKQRKALRAVWLSETVLIIGGLVLLYSISLSLSLFIATVWLVGLWYSHIPHWFVTQNVVVAVCSGSPALTAAAYLQSVTLHDIYTFALFTSLIWLSEVHKDIEDAKIDHGYKDTWATRRGIVGAMLLLIPSLHIVAAFFFWHPNAWLQVVVLTLVPKLAYEQGLHVIGRTSITVPMRTMNRTILACGLTLFIPILI